MLQWNPYCITHLLCSFTILFCHQQHPMTRWHTVVQNWIRCPRLETHFNIWQPLVLWNLLLLQKLMQVPEG